jgi:hypothetical protein
MERASLNLNLNIKHYIYTYTWSAQEKGWNEILLW